MKTALFWNSLNISPALQHSHVKFTSSPMSFFCRMETLFWQKPKSYPERMEQAVKFRIGYNFYIVNLNPAFFINSVSKSTCVSTNLSTSGWLNFINPSSCFQLFSFVTRVYMAINVFTVHMTHYYRQYQSALARWAYLVAKNGRNVFLANLWLLGTVFLVSDVTCLP
jgi:hypothetical protein